MADNKAKESTGTYGKKYKITKGNGKGVIYRENMNPEDIERHKKIMGNKVEEVK
tara:strand:+ start:483 stop:644 length:162 start_codon:yes stop_codon:yes gene_type:complete